MGKISFNSPALQDSFHTQHDQRRPDLIA